MGGTLDVDDLSTCHHDACARDIYIYIYLIGAVSIKINTNLRTPRFSTQLW